MKVLVGQPLQGDTSEEAQERSAAAKLRLERLLRIETMAGSRVGVLRRCAIVTFVLALLLVVACGRQITPNPTTSNLAGKIDLRFRVNGTLAFSTYDYQVVINACGGGVPYPSPGNNSYKNYTYTFNVGTSPFGVLTVYPILLQYKLTTGTTGLTPLRVPPNPSYESLNTNSNGLGSRRRQQLHRMRHLTPRQVHRPLQNRRVSLP
jgi:hypothetical protein